MEDMEGLKGKRILITGGAGFIGGHLVKKLVDLKTKIFVIDIKINPKSYFTQNKLEKKCKFSFVDIRNKRAIGSFFSKNKIDYIFHLAAEPIVEEAFDNPYSVFDTNIMGTVNILEQTRKNKKIKGIIVASSDKAYGKTNNKEYTEDAPLKGDHPYDVSKSSADLIAQAYFKTYSLPVAITRFGNVYGQGDLHFDRIIPGICQSIIEKKKLKVRSNGQFVRDYIHVKDVVNGYVLLLANIEKIYGEAYNFSSGDNLSVIELIKKAEKILCARIKYEILNNAKNEIPYQHLNDLKVRKLGFRQIYNLDKSLKSVFNWYKDIL